jgi:hypothetical protein
MHAPSLLRRGLLRRHRCKGYAAAASQSSGRTDVLDESGNLSGGDHPHLVRVDSMVVVREHDPQAGWSAVAATIRQPGSTASARRTRQPSVSGDLACQMASSAWPELADLRAHLPKRLGSDARTESAGRLCIR